MRTQQKVTIITQLALLVGLVCLIAYLSACSSTKPSPPPVVEKPKPPVAVFTWDRVEGATDYRMYLCWMPGCTPAVPRTEVITQPRFVIDLTGSVGAAAVSARNGSKESGLSNVVRFDRR